MKEYCLIGEHLTHSYSAIIHKQFGYKYDLVELKKEQLKDFVTNCDYKGFNVTIPFKQAIIPFLDDVDELAKKIGAVNTVVKIGKKLYGYNTDILGLKFLLKLNNINLSGKNVTILGSGGTSKMAQFLCENVAKKVNVVSREGDNNYQNLDYSAQIIINTTPVGMFPNNYQCLVDVSKFNQLTAVVDVVYNPNLTKLLLDAKRCNAQYCGGLTMLVAQAKFARDIFFGAENINNYNKNENEVDINFIAHDNNKNSIEDNIINEKTTNNANEVNDKTTNNANEVNEKTVNNVNKICNNAVNIDDNIILEITKKLEFLTKNIVLIGMSCVGKTTIAKELAKQLGRQFIDTDEQIEQYAKKSIAQIFNDDGEITFRKYEVEQLKYFGKQSGLVLAVGGGAVQSCNAYEYLKQNATIVWVKRKQVFIGGDRPLLKDKSNYATLLEKRKPIYKLFADFEVDNNTTVEETVEKIINLLQNMA
ncbi:MAG: shikimate kinase [Clostridia bacterium]